MTTMEIGKELVTLCKQGKNQDAIDRLYSPNIESVEPVAMPGMEQTQRGVTKIKGKNQWWTENHEIHGSVAEGPFPHGDRFIVRFKYDVTPKHMTRHQGGVFLFYVGAGSWATLTPVGKSA